MVPQGIHESSSWNSSSQSKGKSHQFAPRPFSVQAKQDFHRPPAQEELENESFNQHKLEAFGLQLKETIKIAKDVEEGRELKGIFTAYDKESNASIGIIVIEKRAWEDFPGGERSEDEKWYLRWLIGHPTMKGAGGVLLEKALKHAGENGAKAVWVESAPSAMGWYKSKGFKPLSKEDQEKYNKKFEEGWDSVLMVLNLS